MHMEGARFCTNWALDKLQMTFQTLPNWPNGVKTLNSKSQHFHTLEMNKVKSKNAILHGEVLVHDECIFGKRGLNGACRKKPHQIWPKGS